MILQLFILSLPLVLELIYETRKELREKISINHFWSAVIRGALMLVIAGLFNMIGINDWWRALVFMVTLHFMFFNYLYNALTNRKLTYLRDKGIDKVLQQVGWLGVLFFQIILLSVGIMIYFKIDT
jgi:hypothetical protein